MKSTKEYDWTRYPPDAEAAWKTFNMTGDRSAVIRVICSRAERMEPRRLWAVFLWTLTQAGKTS